MYLYSLFCCRWDRLGFLNYWTILLYCLCSLLNHTLFWHNPKKTWCCLDLRSDQTWYPWLCPQPSTVSFLHSTGPTTTNAALYPYPQPYAPLGTAHGTHETCHGLLQHLHDGSFLYAACTHFHAKAATTIASTIRTSSLHGPALQRNPSHKHKPSLCFTGLTSNHNLTNWRINLTPTQSFTLFDAQLYTSHTKL